MKYLYLAIAIIAEVIGTSAMKSSNGFTKILPTATVIIGYGVSFYFLSIVLKTIPIGIAYSIWSGLGVALIVIAGFFIYHQKLDAAALAGISLIIAGVIVINVFSKSVGH